MRLLRRVAPLLVALPFVGGLAACGPSPTTFTVNSTADAADAKVGDAVCATAGNVCTFRAAIQEANANVSRDTIQFSIGTGLHTITPASALPKLVNPVVLDASTQPGSGSAPRIELNGSNVGTAPVLDEAGGASAIRGFLIDHAQATGILLEGTVGGTTVAGNVVSPAAFAGDSSGPTAIKATSPNNVIGGTTAADRNTVNHASNGVWVLGGSGNVIEGNYIGLNSDGSTPLGGGNGIAGVLIQASNTTLGGTSTGARNVISNNFMAVSVYGRNGSTACASQPTADGAVISGNFIGTSPAGLPASTGNYAGLDIFNAANVRIGGTAAGSGNVISDNLNTAIGVRTLPNACSGVSQNVSIAGNSIGVAANGSAAGNGGSGVAVYGPSRNVAIGGTAAGAANRIHNNSDSGVIAFDDAGGSPLGVTIVGNSIDGNGRLGIDLAIDGVTPNHVGGPVGGPNGLLNYPVLTNELVLSGTTVTGTVNGDPGRTYAIDVYDSATCDPSGHGEGGTYLGRVSTTTDGAGNAGFTFSTPTTVPVPSQLTATTTDGGGSTSELSSCLPVSGFG